MHAHEGRDVSQKGTNLFCGMIKRKRIADVPGPRTDDVDSSGGRNLRMIVRSRVSSGGGFILLPLLSPRHLHTHSFASDARLPWPFKRSFILMQIRVCPIFFAS